MSQNRRGRAELPRWKTNSYYSDVIMNETVSAVNRFEQKVVKLIIMVKALFLYQEQYCNEY